MNSTLTVFLKEVRENIRDRRTVIARTTEFVARIASGAAPREGRAVEAAPHGQ